MSKDTMQGSNQPIGLVGAGIMGSAMLGNLLRAEFEVLVSELNEERAEAAQAAGGTLVSDPRDFAGNVRLVLCSLPNAAALEDTASALASVPDAGFIVIETSTLSLESKRQALAHLEAAGSTMLDAPLSGTGAQAQERDLSVFASGNRTAFDSALPVLQAIARSIDYLGEFGAGMTMKLIANHLVAIHSLAAAEALALGERAGIPPGLMVAVLNKSAGASRMLEVRGPVIAKEQFDPPTAHLETLLKDLDIIQSFSSKLGANTPLLDSACDVYRAAGREGWGRRDISEIFRFLKSHAFGG